MLEKLPIYRCSWWMEFADLMMTVGKRSKTGARLAQSACGNYSALLLATQRPSVDVITGLIKANIPTRIAFTVSSKIDSRPILVRAAESLLGWGICLLRANSTMPVRCTRRVCSRPEVHAGSGLEESAGRPQ